MNNATGTLRVMIRYHGPSDVRPAIRASGRAPWIARSVEVIRADEISHADATEMVNKLCAENSGVEFEADWVGPFNLLGNRRAK